ncbi:NACHT domain-containing protein, partial [Leptodontidium sp. MPI-SDFR-AT-0119]
MRLLQYNNGSDFCLTEFFESDIPKYAILSHRWGPEEVTLADLKNGNGKKMAGYGKIQFCGEQAKRDGLQYFWVDTCCIDKSNSTELAEAINSMFRWYQKAARCYVYLSDVSTRKRKASDTATKCTWESAFRDSEWFTRGWTLQELLAPRSVEFFSRNCERLGDKGTLKRQIQEITAIPISALDVALLSQFTVEERLSWAENRQTTRGEDMAYSLLGIFGIHLPLIYGEGKEHAFRRLKKKIQKSLTGDPGKGKTMLICGIIDEMSPWTKLRDKEATTLLAYFFCQATDDRIDNASAALRGLIYLLIDQQPLLISHVRKKYDHAGKALFEDANAWVALSEIFTSILQDPSLKSIYLIIDALDECKANLDQLLDLISRTASTSTRVKWIVSSRNEPNIEARLRLDHTQTRLSLKLNEEHVSRAVQLFIDFKVSTLRLIEDDSELQERVRGQIYAKANGTFLWAALVLKELEPDMPPELEPLYDRMLRQVEQLQRKDPEFCRLVLSTITLAYRPLHLLEVGALSDLPRQISSNLDKVVKVVNKCGSFLTVRDNRTYFIHQSAKDFLLKNAFDRVFPSGKADVIYTMFSRSLEVMSKTLRRDIYGLRAPGYPIEMVEPPAPDPLAAAQYSCLYWVDHLLEYGGSVHQFLRTSYMFWLEALSLMKSLPDGIVMIMKLENWIKVGESPNVHAFIYDARRFALHNRSIIEQVPLQVYCSALIFAPEKSIVRETFEEYIPSWIQRKPKVETYWN